LLSTIAEERMAAYEEQQNSISSFRIILEKAANEVSRDERPLVVMIDELDRCRPTYAIELLEIAKHLFSVPGIIFVLAVNRSELEHSVKAIYGGEFDGIGYLHRFFDIDFRLPKPNRKRFISEVLHSTEIHEYFKRTKDGSAQRTGLEEVENIVTVFFERGNISLREISNAISHLCLVLASLRSELKSFHLSVVVALVFRTLWPELYFRFCQQSVGDVEVIETVFATPGMEDIRETGEGIAFEMVIITAELRRNKEISPLLEKYKKIAEDTRDFRVERIINSIRFFDEHLGFEHAVRRIELISGDLLGR